LGDNRIYKVETHSGRLQVKGRCAHLMGQSHQIFGGPFFPCMDRSGLEKEPLLPFNFSFFSFYFWQAILSFEAFHTKTFLESPRWIYKCGWQFLEIFYFLLGELLELIQLYWRNANKFG